MNLKEDNHKAYQTHYSKQGRNPGTGYRMERTSGTGKI